VRVFGFITGAGIAGLMAMGGLVHALDVADVVREWTPEGKKLAIERVKFPAHDEMVLIKDIPFFSVCEHHLTPFFGKAHIAYVPSEGKIVGLSKLATALEILAKRPQVQERLTAQLADLIMNSLRPKGAMVVLDCEHLCMSMRGVKKPGSRTVTSAVRGIFRSKASTRTEMLELIKK